jgi:hypothetical protein
MSVIVQCSYIFALVGSNSNIISRRETNVGIIPDDTYMGKMPLDELYRTIS